MSSEMIWVEKYRPVKIEDCILPQEYKVLFQQIAKSGDILNFIFSGTPGIGKTTVAKALCKETDSDYMMINGSLNVNLDVLRNDITGFCSTLSLEGERKAIIFDEADHLNKVHTQPALRALVEEFSSTTSFIFTCNHPGQIIPALHSRCSLVDFKIPSTEKPVLAKNLLNRIEYILNCENIHYDQKALIGVIMRYFPDFRKILNELQKFSTISGDVTAEMLNNGDEQKFTLLYKYLKESNFDDIRMWVVENIDIGVTHIVKDLYKAVHQRKLVTPETIPTALDYLNEMQKADPFVADKELNIMANLILIITQCEFV